MKKMTQWLAPPVALLVLAGVVLITVSTMNATPPGPPPVKSKESMHADVSVLTVRSASYKSLVSGFGESKAHYQLALVAEVSGRVEEIAASFESGGTLKKGEMLLQLEDTKYRAELTTAESLLAEARVNLLEEERQVNQARVEWESSGLAGEPESELVLRLPQLAAARASVETASAELELARKDLEKTKVTAPFDGLVVSREVAPGSYLQAGTEIGSLFSVDKVEIAIALSTAEWANLPEASGITGQPVTISAVENGSNWQGKVSRVQHHVDTGTRLRTVIIEVENPLELAVPLLPGTFVSVEISGRSIDNLWKLPGSALSQRGEIWYVTEDNVLTCFQTKPVFSDRDSIYIRVPENLADTVQRILVHPLSNYLIGMNINPVEAKNEQS